MERIESSITQTIFDFFYRNHFPTIVINESQRKQIREDFIAYLKDRNFSEKQLNNFLPKNAQEVVMSLGNPIKSKGFEPAFVLHFLEFIKLKSHE